MALRDNAFQLPNLARLCLGPLQPQRKLTTVGGIEADGTDLSKLESETLKHKIRGNVQDVELKTLKKITDEITKALNKKDNFSFANALDHNVMYRLSERAMQIFLYRDLWVNPTLKFALSAYVNRLRKRVNEPVGQVDLPALTRARRATAMLEQWCAERKGSVNYSQAKQLLSDLAAWRTKHEIDMGKTTEHGSDRKDARSGAAVDGGNGDDDGDNDGDDDETEIDSDREEAPGRAAADGAESDDETVWDPKDGDPPSPRPIPLPAPRPT